MTRNNVLPSYTTSKDHYRLEHIFKLLGTRIIPCYFFTQNPQEFVKWQFNACKQTALISAYFFNKLLMSFYGGEDVEIKLWDGEFKDDCTGWYNHAWMTAELPEASFKTIIDVARVSTMPIVELCTASVDPIQNSILLREWNTKLLKQTEMKYYEMLGQTEYYTGLTGYQVCRDIEKMMHVYNYKLEEFTWENKPVIA